MKTSLLEKLYQREMILFYSEYCNSKKHQIIIKKILKIEKGSK